MSIPEYQQAYRDFKAARGAAIEMAEAITKINDAMRYELRAFIGFNFDVDIEPRRGRYNEKGRIDIAKWPSSEEMRQTIQAWTSSYANLVSKWNDLPEADREGLIPPPQHLRLSEY